MKKHFLRALDNINIYGDTDVLPLPFENIVFHDCQDDVIKMLCYMHKNFHVCLTTTPPENVSLLAPSGYTGFRWVTQLDPVWNVYFLGLVIAISRAIEQVRIPPARDIVFSYRVANSDGPELFEKDINWNAFMKRSLHFASRYKFVVMCDIGDFYLRIRHHRLDNALKQVDQKSDIPFRIMAFLSSFSHTYSHGLPVGGPAARILSELLLNQTDRLLLYQGMQFCPFADDYHIFANSLDEAYRNLLFLSEKLLGNEGLSIQKSKTRVMSASEFVETAPIAIAEAEADQPAQTHAHDPETSSVARSKAVDRRAFMRLSLRFDPYSPTAEKDYEALRDQIEKFDIFGMLRRELSKTRIDIAVSRRIIKTLKFLNPEVRNGAVLSILENVDVLYPIFSSVMILFRQIFDDLSHETQDSIIRVIRNLFDIKSRIVEADINIAFALRVLSRKKLSENVELAAQIYARSQSAIVRRDVILTMSMWREWAWVSDLRSRFRSLSQAERRAFIVASYTLGEEGKHWREHTKKEFSAFERQVHKWMANRVQQPNWSIPL